MTNSFLEINKFIISIFISPEKLTGPDKFTGGSPELTRRLRVWGVVECCRVCG